MKVAFTIIELIFVIVILGVLVGVAIPKLAATRDDAKISKIAMNIMTGASEIAAYAVNKATVDNNLSQMSNAISSLVGSGIAILDVENKKVDISLGNSICSTISIDTNETIGTDTLKISFNNANESTLCTALENAIGSSKYPMKLRGQNVTY